MIAVCGIVFLCRWTGIFQDGTGSAVNGCPDDALDPFLNGFCFRFASVEIVEHVLEFFLGCFFLELGAVDNQGGIILFAEVDAYPADFVDHCHIRFSINPGSCRKFNEKMERWH